MHNHIITSGISSTSEDMGLRDPVCGMTVKADSPHRLDHAGIQYAFCCAGCKTRFAADTEKYLPALAAAQKDPVCGMSAKADSPHRLGHAGIEYVFCCAGCKAKFAADPQKYLQGAAPAASAEA